MRTRERRYGALSLILVMLMLAPPVRDGLERWMTTHVAVQLSGLAVAGWLLGMTLRRTCAGVSRKIDANGLCGLALCLFAAAFWMLPRNLDEAILDIRMETAKFLTVPLLVGFPLAMSWPRLNPLLRGFLKATLISKLFVLGWFYTAAPERLCANYWQGDQILLGELLQLVAGALALAWSLPLFIEADTDDGRLQRSVPQVGYR